MGYVELSATSSRERVSLPFGHAKGRRIRFVLGDVRGAATGGNSWCDVKGARDMRSNPNTAALVVATALLGASVAPRASASTPGNACLLLTQAQVAAVLGLPAGAGFHQVPNDLKTCTWARTSSPKAAPKNVTVSIKTVDGFESMKKVLDDAKAMAIADKDSDEMKLGRTPVSGIGDDAYYSTDGVHVTLSVRKGSVAFEVGAYGDFPASQVQTVEKTLALEVLSKL